jgi:hypothetical protein
MSHDLEPADEMTVVAKTRKRCPQCAKMVEKGDTALLTDDRFTSTAHMWRTGGEMRVTRGAWHLWHPKCRVAWNAAVADFSASNKLRIEAGIAELRFMATVLEASA